MAADAVHVDPAAARRRRPLRRPLSDVAMLQEDRLPCPRRGVRPPKLSAPGRSVTVIDRLPSQVARVVDSLHLSRNLLTSLAGVQQFTCLRVISVAENKLRTLESVRPLHSLPSLEVASLENNTVTQLPLYRLHVARGCRRLVTLDGRPCAGDRGQAADAALEEERRRLERMLTRHCYVVCLASVMQRRTLHDDFFGGMAREHPRLRFDHSPAPVDRLVRCCMAALVGSGYPSEVPHQLRRAARRERLREVARLRSTLDSSITAADIIGSLDSTSCSYCSSTTSVLSSVAGWLQAYDEVEDLQRSQVDALHRRVFGDQSVLSDPPPEWLRCEEAAGAALLELVGVEGISRLIDGGPARLAPRRARSVRRPGGSGLGMQIGSPELPLRGRELPGRVGRVLPWESPNWVFQPRVPPGYSDAPPGWRPAGALPPPGMRWKGTALVPKPRKSFSCAALFRETGGARSG